MAHAVLDAMIEELKAAGVTEYRVETGGKHGKLYFPVNGRETFHIYSFSDRDINQKVMLSRQDIRRTLGISTRLRDRNDTSKTRKTTQRTNVSAAVELPKITVKPDPFAALGPLKRHLENKEIIMPASDTAMLARENPYRLAHFNALSAEVIKVTPAMAKQLGRECLFDRQRSIRPEHVNRLASEMKSAWFLAGTPVWFCVLPDKKHVLVNGNHTLAAVVESGVTIPLTFVYQLVQNVEEAAQAYACFDIQRSRTWMQAAQAQGLSNELPLLNKALPAMSWIMADFKESQEHAASNSALQSRHLRFDMVKEYRGALMSLQELLTGTLAQNQRLIGRAATFAVAMVTMKAQPSAAEEFWGGMAKDDGLRVGDPRRTLLRYAIANPVRVAARDILLASAIGWNAFFENRQIDSCRPSQMKIFRIAGTKWQNPPKVAVRSVKSAPEKAGAVQQAASP